MVIEGENEIQEYIVDKYIKLRLEYGETIIYVGGERFDQCKYLLLRIPVDNIEDFDNINSIDDVAERLDRSMEDLGRYEVGITPETEYWAHCSNLQCWSELQYDTRILHSNLSFPLLRKLMELGDPLARKVFKDEVAKRYTEGNIQVKIFLKSEGYLKQFNIEEIELLNLQNIERIEEKLNNDDIHVLLEVLNDEDDYIFNKVHKMKREGVTSINKALDLIFNGEELEYIHNDLKDEYLKLFIEHPNLNLLELLIEWTGGDYPLFLRTVDYMNEKEPDSFILKISHLVDEHPLENSYILSLIIFSKKGDFNQIVKKVGATKIRKSFEEYLRCIDYTSDINYLLKSPSLGFLINHKRINFLKSVIEILDHDQKKHFLLEIQKQERDVMKRFAEKHYPLEKLLTEYKTEKPRHYNKDAKFVDHKRKNANKNYPNSQIYKMRHANIHRIQNPAQYQRLKIIFLSDNQISEIERLDSLDELEILDLNNNQITEIKGLENLKNLKILRLGRNRISKIEGLDALTQLEELDLNDNQITKIEGIEHLQHLRKIRLYNNPIDLSILHRLGPVAYVVKSIEFVKYCQGLRND